MEQLSFRPAETPARTVPAGPGTPPDPDALLRAVAGEARALGIPVSGRIAPRVRLNRRAKKRFGCCIAAPGGGFVIELAAALPAAGERACRQTLAHEVLHTCPGCQNHGPQWKAYAARMNAAYGYAIRRTDRPESLGVQLPAAPARQPRYRICCTACGRQFTRQKASPVVLRPGRYRCSACGGKLRVETLF